MGTSVGGSSVLLASAKYEKDVDGIISMNPFSSPQKLWKWAIYSTINKGKFGDLDSKKISNLILFSEYVKEFIPKFFF